MLKILQEELPKIWTDELYSKEFKASPSIYKDFQHALLHTMKAAGKLLEMVEESDHHDRLGAVARMRWATSPRSAPLGRPQGIA